MLQDGTCLIDGTCYVVDDKNKNDTRLACRPDSKDKWTLVGSRCITDYVRLYRHTMIYFNLD